MYSYDLRMQREDNRMALPRYGESVLLRCWGWMHCHCFIEVSVLLGNNLHGLVHDNKRLTFTTRTQQYLLSHNVWYTQREQNIQCGTFSNTNWFSKSAIINLDNVIYDRHLNILSLYHLQYIFLVENHWIEFPRTAVTQQNIQAELKTI